ncbi:MAG TPA: twin-arginine translocase subunit TatC [candidate division Zixibacteria bacterium]|nr:twin-arginine translocase subunit TatC [candidate division Zixibacteria bacterium]
MPFTAHLDELRTRLIRCVLAVAVAFVGCFAAAEQIFSLLAAPLRALQAPGMVLIGTAVAEAFLTKLKISLVAAVAVALPVLLWQAWQFVAPGLYAHEKAYARSFVAAGSLFFLAGATFCYAVVLRYGLGFLLHRYEAIRVRPMIHTADYLALVARLVLAFGIMFQLPVAAYFLARVGLIDHRFLTRYFGYGLIGIAALAAVLTPPDLISQVLLMVPLTVLYGVSIAVAYFAGRPRENEER